MENLLSVLVDGLQQTSCSVAVAIVGLSAAGMGHVRVRELTQAGPKTTGGFRNVEGKPD